MEIEAFRIYLRWVKKVDAYNLGDAKKTRLLALVRYAVENEHDIQLDDWVKLSRSNITNKKYSLVDIDVSHGSKDVLGTQSKSGKRI